MEENYNLQVKWKGNQLSYSEAEACGAVIQQNI